MHVDFILSSRTRGRIGVKMNVLCILRLSSFLFALKFFHGIHLICNNKNVLQKNPFVMFSHHDVRAATEAHME